MILDPAMIENAYICNKYVARYLEYKAHLSLLSIKDGKYYFVNNAKLREALNDLPLRLKIMQLF